MEQNNLRLCTDLDANATMSSLEVVDSLSAGFYIGIDTMVVTSGEGIEVVQAVEGNGVFRSIVASSEGVTGDVTLREVVGRLSTKKETITSHDAVGGESRTLIMS